VSDGTPAGRTSPDYARRVPADDVEVEIADTADAIEWCMAQGWSDGLPVVPPERAVVDRFLAAAPWDPDAVLFHEPVRGIEVPARTVVVNAVLAGCRPSYLPVVGAALAAMSHPDFRVHIPASSTGGAAPVIVVNGPIRHEIELNDGVNLFGPGARANATIGRCVRLVLRNALGALPGGLDMATQGWFGKYTACFGEREEASPWPPLHVRRGFPAHTSTVTVLASESAHNIHTCGGATADMVLRTAADVVRCLGSHSDGQSLVVIGPEHAATLAAAGITAEALQRVLFDASRRTLAELKRGGRIEGAIAAEDETRTRPRAKVADDFLVLVGGGDAGCSSAWFPSWSRGRGSVAVTAPLDPSVGPIRSSVPGPASAPGLGDDTEARR